MVLVCHETNDIFLEAAKVCLRGNNEQACEGAARTGLSAVLAAVAGSRASQWVARLQLQMKPPAAAWIPLVQMARYAKHETATTFIFVGECRLFSN